MSAAFNVVFLRRKVQLVVALDGSGDFTSIQKALDACKIFPDQRITIHVKNGIYAEKVAVLSGNTQITIIGESADKTIITFGDYFSKIDRGRNSTFYTSTLKVDASDFVLENMTVRIRLARLDRRLPCMLRAIAVYFEIVGFWEIRIPFMQPENSAASISLIVTSKEPPISSSERQPLFLSNVHFMPSEFVFTAASTTEGKAFGFVS